MIKVENIEYWGFEHAIRGMRNPMNSWDKSDSKLCLDILCENCRYSEPGDICNSPVDIEEIVIGHKDMELMQKLYKGGHPHRKYLRQIMVSMDITAPLYWWKEFDTYKVGTTANSCSTMHKIAAKEFELDDFSHEHLIEPMEAILIAVYSEMNKCREKYLETKDKKWWWQLIQLLPSSYNQKRTVTFTYENVMNMLDYRDPHKLDEWNHFCKVLKSLPYVEEIRGNGIST